MSKIDIATAEQILDKIQERIDLFEDNDNPSLYERGLYDGYLNSLNIVRDIIKENSIKVETETKPKIEDFHDESDPRGCSTSEYNEYLKALRKWEEN